MENNFEILSQQLYKLTNKMEEIQYQLENVMDKVDAIQNKIEDDDRIVKVNFKLNLAKYYI